MTVDQFLTEMIDYSEARVDARELRELLQNYRKLQKDNKLIIKQKEHLAEMVEYWKGRYKELEWCIKDTIKVDLKV